MPRPPALSRLPRRSTSRRQTSRTFCGRQAQSQPPRFQDAIDRRLRKIGTRLCVFFPEVFGRRGVSDNRARSGRWCARRSRKAGLSGRAERRSCRLRSVRRSGATLAIRPHREIGGVLPFRLIRAPITEKRYLSRDFAYSGGGIGIEIP